MLKQKEMSLIVKYISRLYMTRRRQKVRNTVLDLYVPIYLVPECRILNTFLKIQMVSNPTSHHRRHRPYVGDVWRSPITSALVQFTLSHL